MPSFLSLDTAGPEVCLVWWAFGLDSCVRASLLSSTGGDRNECPYTGHLVLDNSAVRVGRRMEHSKSLMSDCF